MVEPNGAICWKLIYLMSLGVIKLRESENLYVPMIKFLYILCTQRMENAHEMGEKRLPHAKFKLMHDIDNQCAEYIKLGAFQTVR